MTAALILFALLVPAVWGFSSLAAGDALSWPAILAIAAAATALLFAYPQYLRGYAPAYRELLEQARDSAGPSREGAP